MAAINELLKQITDETLQKRLSQEFNRFRKDKKFGLVFEEHIPECTPLHGVPVRSGLNVTFKSGKINNIMTVIKVESKDAFCRDTSTGEIKKFPLDDLVVVAQFGEPIFPSLAPIDKVENAPNSEVWHTLIEADNYHALQLLEYIYPKKVDCIYIDPPYNTGARDWKYNNDYVDSADSWRHSKWLSMMEKRLRLAKQILKNDGVLITTIDDNEYAHLWMLLHEIFPEYSHTCITIQHNPGGTQGKKFSVTNEYAIYSYTDESAIYRKQHTGGGVYNLRRWGSTSGRYEGATCFYPIILDEFYNIIGFGELLDEDLHPSSQVETNEDGRIYVWPIDRNNIEKKWRYARSTVESVQDRMFVEKRGERIEIFLRRESEAPKTIWTDSLLNAEAHGTEMIKSILGGGFSYPKSLYAVKEALEFATAGKKDALIVDFFAGSGTTLHAVNLLNSEDNGNRRCILVTNNEVSAEKVRELRDSGYNPGEPEWEKEGICRSVTWPRTKYTIRGYRDDGSPLEGEYFTNIVSTKEEERNFRHLGFVDDPSSLTAAAKKQLVYLLRNEQGKSQLPQSLVKRDTNFIVSEKHSASIIFNTDMVEEWLIELEDQNHIVDFYIVAKGASKFKAIKDRVSNLLGSFSTPIEVKRDMSKGFPTNAEFFKLGFLDKNQVSLGQQFNEVLPILWLKSGAKGRRPEIRMNEEPEMMILPENQFAILVDETKFSTFNERIASVKNIKTIYFVTNSEEAFREMSAEVNTNDTYQLYRDYIDNFVLGSRRY